jgi:hypothetical protein
MPTTPAETGESGMSGIAGSAPDYSGCLYFDQEDQSGLVAVMFTGV